MSDALTAADAGRAAGAWPTLDTDRAPPPGAAPKRICIATPDILGPIKNALRTAEQK